MASGRRPRRSPENARRGRGRPKLISDEQQAGAIARQARDLFLEKGYARTSMEDIAARCHISKRTLYRLFSSKAEIFGAIVDDHRQSMMALPGDYDDLPLEEAIGRIFLVDIDEEAHRKRIEVVRLAIVEGRQFPELAALLHERGGDKSHAMLTEWLEAQARRGRIDIEDARSTAKMLMDMMFGAIVIEARRKSPTAGRRRIGAPICAAAFAFSSTASVDVDFLAAARRAADALKLRYGAHRHGDGKDYG